MSARRTSSTSSIAARPRSCSAASSPARARRSGRSTSRRCSWISWPATRRSIARRGAIRRAPISAGSGPAICSARATRRRFKELMEDTDWDRYGTGNYEKCADCMVHSGYEATAVSRNGPPAVEGRGAGAARHPHRGPDGAGHLAGRSAAGRIRVQRPRRAGDGADQGAQAGRGRLTLSLREAQRRSKLHRCAH